jgi:hypothetical protein
MSRNAAVREWISRCASSAKRVRLTRFTGKPIEELCRAWPAKAGRGAARCARERDSNAPECERRRPPVGKNLSTIERAMACVCRSDSGSAVPALDRRETQSAKAPFDSRKSARGGKVPEKRSSGVRPVGLPADRLPSTQGGRVTGGELATVSAKAARPVKPLQCACLAWLPISSAATFKDCRREWRGSARSHEAVRTTPRCRQAISPPAHRRGGNNSVGQNWRAECKDGCGGRI